MEEENIQIRFAIVRFRTSEETARLRLLLCQHGFDEPTWLDNAGQQVLLPPLQAPGVAEEHRETQSVPARGVVRTMSCGRANFLTLPTVLADTSGAHTAAPAPTTTTSSAFLPLATIADTSGSSSSAQLATYTSNRSSTSESSASHDASPPAPASSEPPARSAATSVLAVAVGESSGNDGGTFSTAARAWVSPAPLRPRGKKPQPHEDPNVYYTCELCKNRILGTRVSNLQNHVRRHSTLKQFQCCYCEYAHNEIAKVRLHMTNNHKDTESAPINNLTPDMRSVWRSLFRECFPTRAQRRRGVRAGTAQSGSASQAGPSGISSSSTSSSGAVRLSSTSQSGSQLPLALRRRRHHRRLPYKKNVLFRPDCFRSTNNHRRPSDARILHGDRTKRGDDDAASSKELPISFLSSSFCLVKNQNVLADQCSVLNILPAHPAELRSSLGHHVRRVDSLSG